MNPETGVEHAKCGITKEEWKSMIIDGTITPDQINVLQKFYREIGHGSTCKQLSEKYGLHYNHYNAKVTIIGKKVQYKMNRFSVINKEKECYWPIPMDGKIMKDRQKGRYKWIIKSELIESLCELSLV